ncbi:hypothetical protein HZF05_19200 [Sphingomonas sp. CGMCC 1.13654]|uniref:DUF883 family protein n=1 Tax=Sphingomonas chungangi TaxID=2683589 RepID=A0A838L9W0_9SPHN|nr:hypothetical protein [Sphingomonas chungangi]MBA2936213.1 hypothetical protein [Sphingomonas chungangi]MVW55598.1 hypothetical protein [Sphingomonas chungangi]
MADELPEGTDHVIPGAQNSSTREKLKADAADLRSKASAKAADIKGQASDKAREYADEGKTRAAAGLDSVAKMISDSASQIDDKLGAAYGDYARRAGDAVSDFSASLRDKDVEELLDDARDLVRRSPAIAIGAAAAAGFVIARIVKAGSEALDETAKAAEPKATKTKKAASDGAETVSAATRKAPAKRKPRTTS